MDDRRRRTRVNFHARADVQTVGARLLDLETRDLSHKGMFVLGQVPLKADQGCTITLHLVGDEENAPVLRMEGRVVRSTADGTAIDFVSMDPDTFLHLRNLVLLNAEDPDEAEKEFGQPAFEDQEA
jgi:hypothetical protein